jgi:hypothetical protein
LRKATHPSSPHFLASIANSFTVRLNRPYRE